MSNVRKRGQVHLFSKLPHSNAFAADTNVWERDIENVPNVKAEAPTEDKA